MAKADKHKRITVMKVLPKGYRTVRVGKKDYFYVDGRFYARHAKGFVSCSPPRGAVVHALPIAAATVVIGSLTYFLHDGCYYQKRGDVYIVVDPPGPRNKAAIKAASTPAVRKPDIDPGQLVRVTVGKLNLRSGPGKRYQVLRQVHHGDLLTVEMEKRGWCYVQLKNGTFGWVMEKYTRPVRKLAKG